MPNNALPHTVTNMHVGEFHSATSVCCSWLMNNWDHQGTCALLKGISMALTFTFTQIFLTILEIDKTDKLTTLRDTS